MKQFNVTKSRSYVSTNVIFCTYPEEYCNNMLEDQLIQSTGKAKPPGTEVHQTPRLDLVIADGDYKIPVLL